MAGTGTIGRFAVRILCVFALVFLGLSHKMAALEKASDSPQLARSLTLPDGSVAALCQPAGHAPHQKAYPDCDACRLSASTLPPAPPCVAFPAWNGVERTFFLQAAVNATHPFGRLPPVRGPPASVFIA